jgi:hypothetical protein
MMVSLEERRRGLHAAYVETESADARKLRNEDQPIENKRFHEIADLASSMISMTCGPRRETIPLAWRNQSLRFRGFGRSGAMKRNEACASIAVSTGSLSDERGAAQV